MVGKGLSELSAGYFLCKRIIFNNCLSAVLMGDGVKVCF